MLLDIQHLKKVPFARDIPLIATASLLGIGASEEVF